ncbi:uncharacterized protein EMH_0039240 [Eimeria mitis]|uniref:Uncharacterized protein n=1 Tax=Eimeria mitis TaxID=44415 RepID=U6K3T2_9EIME|nr:uncharacterized protein EMH_0039240 [Eimeria mitis]CDJ31651.1 hypothetical protein, conserved [Eimeria mitis]
MTALVDERLTPAEANASLHSRSLQDKDALEIPRDVTISERRSWSTRSSRSKPIASSLPRVLIAATASLAAVYLVLRCFQGLAVSYRQNEANRGLAAAGHGAGGQCSGDDSGDDDLSGLFDKELEGETAEDWISEGEENIEFYEEETELREGRGFTAGWEDRNMPARAQRIFSHYLDRIEVMSRLCMGLLKLMPSELYQSLAYRMGKILATQLGILSLNPPSLENERARAGEALLTMLASAQYLHNRTQEGLRISRMIKSLSDLVAVIKEPRLDTMRISANHHQKRVTGVFSLVKAINGYLMGVTSVLRRPAIYPEETIPTEEIERQMRLLDTLFEMQRDRILGDPTTHWFLLVSQAKASQFLLFTRAMSRAAKDVKIAPIHAFEQALNKAVQDAGGVPYLPLIKQTQQESSRKQREQTKDSSRSSPAEDAAAVAARSSLRATAPVFQPRQSTLMSSSAPLTTWPKAAEGISPGPSLQSAFLSRTESGPKPSSTPYEDLGARPKYPASIPWSTHIPEEESEYLQRPPYPTDWDPQGYQRTREEFQGDADIFSRKQAIWTSSFQEEYTGGEEGWEFPTDHDEDSSGGEATATTPPLDAPESFQGQQGSQTWQAQRYTEEEEYLTGWQRVKSGPHSWRRQRRTRHSPDLVSEKVESVPELPRGDAPSEAGDASWEKAASTGFASPRLPSDPSEYGDVWTPLPRKETPSRPPAPPGFEHYYSSTAKKPAADAPLQAPREPEHHAAGRESWTLRTTATGTASSSGPLPSPGMLSGEAGRPPRSFLSPHSHPTGFTSGLFPPASPGVLSDASRGTAGLAGVQPHPSFGDSTGSPWTVPTEEAAGWHHRQPWSSGGQLPGSEEEEESAQVEEGIAEMWKNINIWDDESSDES